MKITFVVPELNLTGGLRVVAIYAQLLSEKGHSVTVVSPNRKKAGTKERIKSFFKWKGYSFQSGFNTAFFDKRDYQLTILDEHRPVVSGDVPDADVIIATFWITADWIKDFPPGKGKKVYFIQHFEIHPWLPVDKVLATFQLPYKRVAVAQWIADEIKAQTGVDDDISIVANGVDSSMFYAFERQKQSVATVGLMYSDRKYKGCDVAFAAIEKARQRIPELKVLSFGIHMPSPHLSLPENTQYFQQPDHDTLIDLYNRCDAWLFSSISEGFGLPILESMACGTPVIGTKSGAAPDLITSDSGYLCEINDIDAIADAILAISNMTDEQWLRTSEKALSIARKHTWQEAVNKFEIAILS